MADVLDRVRKLLALAGSPNVHEAALAAAHAQRLITAHRLEAWLAAEAAAQAEAAYDPDPITDGSAAPLEVARKLRTWRVVLATELARLNGCVAYTVDLPDEQQIRVAGRAAERAAVEALWAGLVARIQWASATEGAGRSRKWHEAFRIGAVDAIVDRLRAGDAEARAEAGEALVRFDAALAVQAAAVDRYCEQELHLAPGRVIRVDPRAYAKGHAAGRTLPLPRR